MENYQFIVQVAQEEHIHFAQLICDEMESSAKARGTGIAKRNPEYIVTKIREGKAVIATTTEGEWAGFCYIETWSHGEFVANSGLIVAPKFRKYGLATSIKQRIFELSRTQYPDAKIFGLTTGLAVMKINSDLGYEPVTYSQLTTDEVFWKGCQSCVNFEILKSKERKNCLCTAMLYDPAEKKNEQKPEEPKEDEREQQAEEETKRNISLFERWTRFKQHVLLKKQNKTEHFLAYRKGEKFKKIKSLIH